MNRTLSEMSGNSGEDTPLAVKEAMDLLTEDDNAFEGFTIDSDDEDIALDSYDIGKSDHTSSSSRELNKQSVSVADDPLQNQSLLVPHQMTNNNDNRNMNVAGASRAAAPTMSNHNQFATQQQMPSSSVSGSGNKATSFASTISNFAKTAANSIQDAMNNASSSAPPQQLQQQHPSIYSHHSNSSGNISHHSGGNNSATNASAIDHNKKTYVHHLLQSIFPQKGSFWLFLFMILLWFSFVKDFFL